MSGRRALATVNANQPAASLAGKRGRGAISDGDDSTSSDTPPATAQTADDIEDDFDHVPKQPVAEERPPATPASSASSASSFAPSLCVKNGLVPNACNQKAQRQLWLLVV